MASESRKVEEFSFGHQSLTAKRAGTSSTKAAGEDSLSARSEHEMTGVRGDSLWYVYIAMVHGSQA